MKKPTEVQVRPDSGRSAWLLLVYQLPAKHSPARVKAWRRLQRIGAVALKNSAYILPNRAEAREDFEWIKTEIIAIGGQALVLGADALDPTTLQEITDLFRAVRGQDFEAIRKRAGTILDRWPTRSSNRSARRRLVQTLRRLRERLREAEAIDYFEAPHRSEAARLLDELERRLKRGHTMPRPHTPAAGTLNVTDYRGRIWLTRPRPGVDRMSSAWLIRRFIDPKATFAFGDRAGKAAMIPFDMFGAELGHHGAACTFETIAQKFAIDDPAVVWLGRIVHDLDLKENTFGLPETVAVGRMVEGLRRMHQDDQTLLDHGMMVFETLYQSFDGRQASRRDRRPKRK
jgi:hypothetical protein